MIIIYQNSNPNPDEGYILAWHNGESQNLESGLDLTTGVGISK